MKKTLLAAALLCGLTSGWAQDDSLRYAPFHLSLFTPLSTNGPDSYHTVNKFTLNLFYSGSAGVDGAEFGGFVNYDRYFVHGAQMAGFANIVGGKVDGFQAAGFGNITKGNLSGAQMAGYLNIAGQVEGSQLAGFMNLAKSVNTLQLAGYLNLSPEVKGAQIAGFTNLGNRTHGLQLAGFLNNSHDVDGAQIAGFLNITNSLRGLQLGFFNIADSVESGLPIGFLSFVKKGGYHKLDLWYDEMLFANAAYKVGVPAFYTMLGAGTRFDEQPFAWAFTFGVGSEISLGSNWYLNPEALFQQFVEKDFHIADGLHHALQLRPLVKFQLSENLGIYAGPSFKALFQDNQLVNYFPPQLDDWTLSDHSDGDYSRVYWLGITAGLTIF